MFSAKRADPEAGSAGLPDRWLPALVRVYPGLREHLWAEDMAGGALSHHQLQCGAGVQQLSQEQGPTPDTEPQPPSTSHTPHPDTPSPASPPPNTHPSSIYPLLTPLTHSHSLPLL